MCWHPFSVTRVALPSVCESYVLASLHCDTGCPPFTVCIFLETYVLASLLCDTGCPPFYCLCIFLESYVLASLLCDTGCPPFTVGIFLETYVLASLLCVTRVALPLLSVYF